MFWYGSDPEINRVGSQDWKFIFSFLRVLVRVGGGGAEQKVRERGGGDKMKKEVVMGRGCD